MPSASAVEDQAVHQPVHEMSQAEINETVAKFAAAARRCQQAGLDAVEIHAAHGVDRAIERRRVGHAVAGVYLGRKALLAQLFLDLRARAVHQHQVYAERREQVRVVGQRVREGAGDGLAAEREDEGLAAEKVDVRRDRPEQRGELRSVQGIGHGWFILG